MCTSERARQVGIQNTLLWIARRTDECFPLFRYLDKAIDWGYAEIIALC